MAAGVPLVATTAGRVDFVVVFFFQAEDGIRDVAVTGVQTCALPILSGRVVARLVGDVVIARLEVRLLEEVANRLHDLNRLGARRALEREVGRDQDRSEERRVGKEWRSRWSPEHQKKEAEKRNEYEAA